MWSCWAAPRWESVGLHDDVKQDVADRVRSLSLPWRLKVEIIKSSHAMPSVRPPVVQLHPSHGA